MIEISDSPDIKQWSDFVYNHPHGRRWQETACDMSTNEVESMGKGDCNRKFSLGHRKLYYHSNFKKV